MAEHRHTNRLAAETSPYLLQHAHNPVDWYPWSAEALERARRENRPILLSIGYSACHWCHVMERESFEDEATAALMNAGFVSIKVDREERPDLDQIYQTAVQVLGGHGGWPLTVFLTPDLKPFFGGTYFPPVPRYGMRSFQQILQAVGQAWQQRREEIDRSGEQLTSVLQSIDAAEQQGAPPPTRATVAAGAGDLLGRFDEEHGGFGTRPKFPNTFALELWLRLGFGGGDRAYVDRVTVALERMAAGGIYDQLGGGFHRYSVDERWLVPHFEKMLYDNALLLRMYAKAAAALGREDFARIARETGEYVLREMTHPEGGFYATQDADSEGEEGRFFAWDESDLAQVLGPEDAAFAARIFGVVRGGNFEHGKSVLHRPTSLADAAKLCGRDPDAAATDFETIRRRLFEAREQRIKPLRDEKVLAGWNGLMLHGLAVAGTLLGKARFIEAAQRASDFIHDRMHRDGTLLRSWKDGHARIEAFGEDHAFLAEGELALLEATGDPRHFQRARSLVDRALDLFADPNGGVFQSRQGETDLIQRPRSSYDNAVPSATSSLTHALIRLHALTGESRYAEAADRTLAAYAGAMTKNAFGFSYLLCALDLATSSPGTLVLSGPSDDPRRQALERAARGKWLPNLVLLPWDGNATLPPTLASLVAGKEEETAAWLCRGATCSLPARTPEELNALLAAN